MVYRMCSKLINSLVSYNNTNNSITLHNFFPSPKLQRERLSTFHFLDFFFDAQLNGCIYLHNLMLFNPSIAFISALFLHFKLISKKSLCASFHFHHNQWKKCWDYHFVFTHIFMMSAWAWKIFPFQNLCAWDEIWRKMHINAIINRIMI